MKDITVLRGSHVLPHLKVTMDMIWIWVIVSCTNCMFRILQEARVEIKVCV